MWDCEVFLCWLYFMYHNELHAHPSWSKCSLSILMDSLNWLAIWMLWKVLCCTMHVFLWHIVQVFRCVSKVCIVGSYSFSALVFLKSGYVSYSVTAIPISVLLLVSFSFLIIVTLIGRYEVIVALICIFLIVNSFSFGLLLIIKMGYSCFLKLKC